MLSIIGPVVLQIGLAMFVEIAKFQRGFHWYNSLQCNAIYGWS